MESKKRLAVMLSHLLTFERPNMLLEQYPTDSEIAAEIIWFASQIGDIKNKVIADLGCGTGILGIGCSFFSPKKIYFVDKDKIVINRLKENLALFEIKNCEIINSDVRLFNKKVDIVFQNPPFGVKILHADKIFLEKAFQISKVIYSFHKIESNNFIEKISKEHNFRITHFFKFDFPLKNTMSFHQKRIEKIKVGCWRLSSTDTNNTW